MQFTLISDTPDNTAKLAGVLSPILKNGDIILLYGDVGAGKTDLSRKIIQFRMRENDRIEDVPSPTYTLVQTYELGGVEFLHADLYRISDPDEIYELALERGFETAICLIEWPERLGAVIPGRALSIHAEILDDTKRSFRFSWTQPDWSDRFRKLKTLDLGSTG